MAVNLDFHLPRLNSPDLIFDRPLNVLHIKKNFFVFHLNSMNINEVVVIYVY